MLAQRATHVIARVSRALAALEPLCMQVHPVCAQQQGSTAHCRFRRRPQAPCSACRASSGDDRDGVQWDTEWSRFKKRANLPSMDDLVDRSPDTGASAPRATSQRPLSPRERQLREQESRLVNVWTQQTFFLACGCVVLLLLLLIIGFGAPSSDPRCTLPWC